ncbi:MAG TPA: hypothetical protein VKB19_00670 [Pedobacter sp.]|nr:hypothetical protein [Pedobacter sp.]
MNKHLLFAASLLIFLAGFTACKKATINELKVQIAGKWNITNIQPSPALPPVLPGDYYDFEDGEDDGVEIKRSGQTQKGHYTIVVNKGINIVVGGKTYFCQVTTVNEDVLEFTSTEGNETETVYLKR